MFSAMIPIPNREMLPMREVDDVPSSIHDILENFTDGVRQILGKSLVKIVLYGSYARGDASNQSDIDVIILVDLSDKQIKLVENQIYDLAFDIELETGKDIAPIIKNIHQYEYWQEDLPFYRNIRDEGVTVA